MPSYLNTTIAHNKIVEWKPAFCGIAEQWYSRISDNPILKILQPFVNYG